ncbi:MAG: hypothetical protein COA36_12595 [Desulfotalea sp.]|nr:MAG: hypothetical protein COA36_12595 [Desulfotalea sp.]
MSYYQKESTDSGDIDPIIEDKNRRRVVKSIVCGLTAFTAYNVLPSKWGTPIIEQVFLPAHAATSGVILSGTFSGTGAIDLVGINRKQQAAGLIAQIGTSIGNFFVSEVHAGSAEHYNIDGCAVVEGEAITYYLLFIDEECLAFAGRVDGVAEIHVGRGTVLTGEIIEKGQDNIRIRVTVEVLDEFDTITTAATTLDLSRSAKICKCDEDIDD